MPNWVLNTIKAKGIGSLPIFRIEDGKKSLDFNKIKPMPEALNVKTKKDEAGIIVYYLTDHGKNKANLKGKEKILADICCLDSSISEDWIDEKIEHAKACALQDGEEEIYMLGKRYLDNFKKYGSTNWYVWRMKHWGTGCNANGCSVSDDAVNFDTPGSVPDPISWELSKQYPDITFTHGYTFEEEIFPFMDDEDVKYDGHMHELVWFGGELISSDGISLVGEERDGCSDQSERNLKDKGQEERIMKYITLKELANYASTVCYQGYCLGSVAPGGDWDPATEKWIAKQDAAEEIIADFFFAGDKDKARKYIHENGETWEFRCTLGEINDFKNNPEFYEMMSRENLREMKRKRGL